MGRQELIKHYAKWEKLDKEGCTAVCFHFAGVSSRRGQWRRRRGSSSFKQATTQHRTPSQEGNRMMAATGPRSCQWQPFNLREWSKVLEMNQVTTAMSSHEYAQNIYSHFITKFKLQPVSSHGVNTKCSFGASGSYRAISRWKGATLAQLWRLYSDRPWFLPSSFAYKTMLTVSHQFRLLETGLPYFCAWSLSFL